MYDNRQRPFCATLQVGACEYGSPHSKGNQMSIADLRKEYSRASLSESSVSADPFAQFAKWFNEAVAAKIPEPNAMSAATVGANGRPSSRILLVKHFDQRGFVWFTNYDSRKGRELQKNPFAALLFHWAELERQVRIEGRVERIAAEESEAYFHSRPLKSRLGAVASHQSELISDRETLEARYADAAQQYGDHPPRPEQWGGYRLMPDSVEFWQGRRSRLHDRILYTMEQDGSWQRRRLQP
jgi:pyridoxamine 5'-phosphate oxidase